ncbi:chemotaxis protein CheW [uncultured Enterovirga sp.]|uniref:hybrid sensor histidine kinase/response regulator n=1 Tax=uncultured Enterovirga sp. TaxID=2026352 RepID=UPI0035CB4041
MDDLLREFLAETGEHLDTVDLELVRFEQNPSDAAILRNVFRLVHTIKGTCGFLGLPRLEALAHAAETLMGRLRDGMPVTADAVTLILATVDRIKMILADLDRAAAEPDGSDSDIIARLESAATAGESPERPDASRGGPVQVSLEELERAFQAAPGPDVQVPAAAPPAARTDPAEPGVGRGQTIRVALDTLEHLMTMVSELVLTRNQLLDLARRTDGEGGFSIPLQRLSHVTAELQDGIMKTRMQPIGSAWAKLPRIVRDLAPELGKKVELVMSGAETELDRQILELIRDPLTHMVRNSVDHGIEPPDFRVRQGKPAHGTIRLNAFHEGGTITIEMADDGRGLDHAAIRRRAAGLGLVPAADLDRMGDDQIAKLIFHPGFSTQDAVSAVSGRGVGMDVVLTNIAAIGGTVEISSGPGRGALFTIKIPLTLAIVPALIIEAGGQRFALPQGAVVELVHARPESDTRLERIHGAAVIRLRSELLPVIDLAGLLGLGQDGAETDAGFVVVLQVGRQRFGLLVASVLETEEIVVKPMASRLRHLAVFSGNTILGDGAIVLIVDPNGIARAAGSELLRGLADVQGGTEAMTEVAETVTLLVFRGADRVLKALPLSVVTRLEEVDAAAIEEVGGRPTLPYRGRLMPIISLDGPGRLRREGIQPLIVVTEGGRHIALAVHEIVDVIESELDVDPVSGRPDLAGCAIVQGRPTEIVDIAHYVPSMLERPEPEAAAAARRSLLLVDDNAFFRDMLAPVLKAAGFRVCTAASVAEALRILARHPVDALVTDLDLPDRGGLDLVEELRRQPATRHATVVLLAAAAGPEILDRARALDVYDVVAKFDRSGLMAALSEAEADLDLAA